MFALAYTPSYPEEKTEETKKIIELINAILQLDAEQSGGIREDVEEVKEARSIVEKLKSIEDVRRAIERFIPRLPNFEDIKVNIKVNTSVRLPTIAHVKVETLNQTAPPPTYPPPPPSYEQQPPPPPPQRAPPPQGGGGNRAMLYLAIGLAIAVVFAGLFIYELFQYQALQYKYSTLQNQYNSLNTVYTTLENEYNTLQNHYSSLQGSYNNLLSSIKSFDTYSYNDYTEPGDTIVFPIFVPSGYDATVHIFLYSGDYFDVGIYPIPYSSSSQVLVYWRDVSYLSETVTLSPGAYVIAVYDDPNYNVYGAYVTIDISTTLTPAP